MCEDVSMILGLSTPMEVAFPRLPWLSAAFTTRLKRLIKWDICIDNILDVYGQHGRVCRKSKRRNLPLIYQEK